MTNDDELTTCQNCLSLVDEAGHQLRDGGQWDSDCDLNRLKHSSAGCRTCRGIHKLLLSELDQRCVQIDHLYSCSIGITTASTTRLLITCFVEYAESRTKSAGAKTLLLAFHYAMVDSKVELSVAHDCHEAAYTDIMPETARWLNSTLDTRLVHRWRQLCAEHGSICSQAPGRTSRIQIRLIDLQRRCLVDATTESRYTALSYVWGPQSAAADHRLVSTNLLSYFSPGSMVNFPRSIMDAMDVSQQLGYDYLFVDAICIMQDQPADTQYYVSQMDIIYGMADITIVNASGVSADDCIAGVRPGDRSTARNVLHLGGLTLLEEMNDSNQQLLTQVTSALRNTTWNTRSWTYQERHLSRRLLIFTKRRVVWECTTANYCEDMALEHVDWKNIPLYRQRIRNFDPDEWKQHGNLKVRYDRLVEEYTARKLTYRSDIWNAFQGIANAFTLNHPQYSFFWGTPTRNFLFHLCFAVENELVSSELPLISDEAADQMPSWSWLAWPGRIRPVVLWSDDSAPMHSHHAFRVSNIEVGAECRSLECLSPDLPERPYQGQDNVVPQVADVPAWIYNCAQKVNQTVLFRARVASCTLAEEACIFSSTSNAVCPSTANASSPLAVSKIAIPVVQWHHRPHGRLWGSDAELIEMIAYPDGQLRMGFLFLVVMSRCGVQHRVGLCTVLYKDLNLVPADSFKWETVVLN